MMNEKNKWLGVLRAISGKVTTSLKLAGIVLNNRFEKSSRDSISESKTAFDRDGRRKAKRLTLGKDIIFKYAHGKPAFGHIVNISKRGMYIITDVPLNDGEEINANLLWENLGSLTSLEGHIVRRGDNGVAVRFI
jgi:hypothetical protein